MNAQVFLATTGRGIARAARGRGDAWEVEHLLPGQKVHCLAADPHHAGRVYAGAQEGLLRSDDGGLTWNPAGLAGQVIRAVAVSPADPDLLFAGTRPAYVFASRDGGASWSELESFRSIPGRRLWWSPADAQRVAYVLGLAPSPTDPDNVVAGIEFGAVIRSTDGGQSWGRHLKGALRDCHSMTFHATDGNWVYEGGGSGGGAAFSRDGGATWHKAGRGMDRHYGWAVAADPGDPAMWYVSVSPGPMKAHGGKSAEAHIYRRAGESWEKLGGGLPDPLDHMPYALLTDPAEPGHLYAGLSNGDVWFSADYGEAWGQLPFNLRGIHRTMIMV